MLATTLASSIPLWVLPAIPVPAGQAPADSNILAGLVVHASPDHDRKASLTNKRSAFYYTQLFVNNDPEHAWFRGFDIAGRRVFNDYRIRCGDLSLDHATAVTADVTPDAVTWRHPSGWVETLRLYDQRDVVSVELSGKQATGDCTMTLSGDVLHADSTHAGHYVSTTENSPPDHVVVGHAAGRFVIAVAGQAADAGRLAEAALADIPAWRAERLHRLQGLVDGDHRLETSDARTTAALRWITLTTDQLVTRQRGDGIYAGLPWFPEYWGRDEFISLPGATLVTGQFAQAREILVSFARFQDLDPASRFYGRVPNIVKPGSLDYHTTDGTPRFVIGLHDYLGYSGDRELVALLYPNVKASIEGALAHWTDASGYLVHADNETWMDARRSGDLRSYSPRANRANDIQALWIRQLRAGVEFARLTGDATSAKRWKELADRVESQFVRDFVDPASGRVADHLDAVGRADFTLRPNLLFALELLPEETAARELKRGWENLVFPWGVTTIDPASPAFHPWHLAPERWHKDAAYHNGAVWPWLDGIAIQRMVEFGQVEPAWRLLDANNALALTRGVAGGLPETMDAYPHPGETSPRLTGTYLQAWSNAEQLRVFYQYVLGVRPDLGHGQIELAPRLPRALGRLESSNRIGRGVLRSLLVRTQAGLHCVYRLDGEKAALAFDLPGYPRVSTQVTAGDRLVVDEGNHVLRFRHESQSGRRIRAWSVHTDPASLQRQQRLATLFGTVRFAQPDRANSDREPADLIPPETAKAH